MGGASTTSTTGAGGMGGASTTSTTGAGGMGTGGAGGAAPTGTLLVLAGSDATEAHWSPGAGWATGSINLIFSGAAVTPYLGGALAIGRRVSGLPGENDQLMWSLWMPGSGFGPVSPVNGATFAKGVPALGSFGFAALALWLGTDNKHHYSQFENGLFSPTGFVPAGMVQNPAFGPSAAALSNTVGANAISAVYAGDDGKAYHVDKLGPGGSWAPSSQVVGSTVDNTVAPAAIIDAANDLLVFYVRQSDKRLCMNKLTTPQNTWGVEQVLHQDALSAQSPSVTLTSTGDILVAWHGFNDEGVYFLRGNDGAWGAPVTVATPLTPTTRPIALRGLAGADAEIVYATGGKLKHARVSGAMAVVSEAPVQTNVTSVAATVLP
jgi:hypothetical protein